MKNFIGKFLALLVIVLLILPSGGYSVRGQDQENPVNLWQVQSIDTMKYSRDLAREKLYDSSFDAVINSQMDNIAATGVTHVAIATPYDVEFLPMLYRWVNSARSHGLKVWFRGNFSGWERWFNYSGLNRDEHIQKTRDFILDNSSIFADGDIFTSCPECENGGPGDPRSNGDLVGHRAFLINEYQVTKDAFLQIGKNVTANFYSMNGDVARLVMDPATTQALDGIVTVDHYVSDTDRLKNDLETLASESQGKVVLGEFGVPIPDIHGYLTEAEQAAWLEDALQKLSQASNLIGVNYWVGYGGSTRLWETDGTPLQAVGVLTKYYKPQVLTGTVANEVGDTIPDATVSVGEQTATTDSGGEFTVPYVAPDEPLTVSAPEYQELIVPATEYQQLSQPTPESQEPTPTSTPMPTSTPTPTSTPMPTSTPTPTPIPTPTPTVPASEPPTEAPTAYQQPTLEPTREYQEPTVTEAQQPTQPVTAVQTPVESVPEIQEPVITATENQQYQVIEEKEVEDQQYKKVKIVLKKEKESWFFKIRKFLYHNKFFRRLFNIHD